MITEESAAPELNATTGPTVSVTGYLLGRLAELGVEHVFGVPGDYNLAVLDEVVSHPSIDWVGTAGELGAAYAADAYGRVKGFGALLTTSGVGELSAINGVAGSFAERVALLHITVGPTQAMEQSQAVVHHTAGDGDYTRFARAHANVTCAQGVLRPATAAEEIDRVLLAALDERRPAYLRMPSDVAALQVPAPRAPLIRPDRAANAHNLAQFTAAARSRVAAASTIAVLADYLADRYGARDALAALVSTGLPHAVVSTGKTVLDEGDPLFMGVYAGALSEPRTRATVDDADLLIRVGVHLADTTSGAFSQGFAGAAGIDLQPQSASVDGVVFDGVPLKASLKVLTALVRDHADVAPAAAPARCASPAPAPANEVLTQELLWDVVAANLSGRDLAIADQGTSFFGVASRRFPSGSRFIAQPLWGSIGYGVPAVLGAQLADPTRRVVLLVGDGAAQLTIGELGTIARHGLCPVIVLVNNDGYTVERAIHRPRAAYHDIAAWDWPAIPAALGAHNALVRTVRTASELTEALAAGHAADRLVFIEAVTGRDDVPELLRLLAERVAPGGS